MPQSEKEIGKSKVSLPIPEKKKLSSFRWFLLFVAMESDLWRMQQAILFDADVSWFGNAKSSRVRMPINAFGSANIAFLRCKNNPFLPKSKTNWILLAEIRRHPNRMRMLADPSQITAMLWNRFGSAATPYQVRGSAFLWPRLKWPSFSQVRLDGIRWQSSSGMSVKNLRQWPFRSQRQWCSAGRNDGCAWRIRLQISTSGRWSWLLNLANKMPASGGIRINWMNSPREPRFLRRKHYSPFQLNLKNKLNSR